MYSQNKEEHFIVNFFKDKPVGNLLDIGANDGITCSNSLRLIELGWQAVLVEPSPRAFSHLQKTHSGRENIHLFNFAITNSKGEIKLYESGAIRVSKYLQDNVGLVSTLDKNWTKPWKKTRYQEIMVPCLTFADLLLESPIKKFQFITIDTEGEDLNILKQIQLKDVGCELLCIEYIYPDKIEPITKLCEVQGYKLVGQTKCNLLFALNA